MLHPSPEEKAALLAALPLFASLSAAERLALALRSHWHQWPKAQAIFHEGEKAHGMHIVLQGMVKVFHNSADGRERVLHLIRPGNTLGEAAVFQRGTYPAHAATLIATTALYVPADVLLTLIAENPDLALRMLAALSLRLRMFTRKLEAHTKSDATSRLAAYLLHRLRLNQHRPDVEPAAITSASTKGTSSRVEPAAITSASTKGTRGRVEPAAITSAGTKGTRGRVEPAAITSAGTKGTSSRADTSDRTGTKGTRGTGGTSGAPLAPAVHIRLEVSREILANMLGIARETVSRTFSRLQQVGILSLTGRDIYILDVDALQSLAEKGE